MSISHALSINGRALRFDAYRLCTVQEMRLAIGVAVAYFSNLGENEGAYVFVAAENEVQMPSLEHFALAVRTMIECKRIIRSHVKGTIILSKDESVNLALRTLKRLYKFRRPVFLFTTMEECMHVLLGM